MRENEVLRHALPFVVHQTKEILGFGKAGSRRKMQPIRRDEEILRHASAA